MKMSHTTIAALVGLAMTFGAPVYGQSSGGGSAGGGGASTGAASGGVAGASGSAGVASGVAGPGSGALGIAGGVRGNPGMSGAAPIPGAFNQSGFNRGGFNAGQQFGAGQNQPGFGQNQQRFDRFNQNLNQAAQNQGQNGFIRNQRSVDRQQGLSGPSSFDRGDQGDFTQGIDNQGAFGLGNGNRSGFFDNQPFNTNQAFGQRAGGGSGANSSAGFTGANDPGGFTGSGSVIDGPDGNFSNGDFGDRGFGNERFDRGSFRSGAAGDGFQGDFDGNDNRSASGDPRFGDGEDVSSSEAPSGFGATSDFESETGAGAGANSSRGFTAANDPPGFNGTTSPLSRSSDGDIGEAGEKFNNSGMNDNQGMSRRGSQQNFVEQQQQFGVNNRAASSGSNTGFGNNDGGAVDADDEVDRFGRGTSSTFPSANEPFDDRGFNGTAPGASGGDAGSDQQERDPFDDPLFQGRDFGGGMPGNHWHGPGMGAGVTAPGEYGFMQQYSNMRFAPASNTGGAINGAGQGPARGSRPPASSQNSRQRPNYFNGSYSRSRL